ncbi:MAG: DUF1343 domain-containing protein [Verrucomicrobia bacterium]|nr:DUF1343 domain-containing protein [Verrucomicrobiota bacterium]MCH8510627.1 DUF1343 domain-containing protein [Kiritimatiellia bacterium]
MFGLDVLLARPAIPLPHGRPKTRVGLLAHAASRDLNGVHAAHRLMEKPDWQLLRLFSPEHGFHGTGAAGEIIHSQTHPELNLPIHSLYGDTRTPPPEWLEGLDLMVIDLQDLGIRCYTYASTLQNVLLACASAKLPVLVLDRPTPLAGIVDGPDLDPRFRSFVGQIDLPLVYGLSQGELARHLQQHDPRLKYLDLEVISATLPSHELPWYPPSPAIGSPQSARLYPLTVWCEAIPDVSVDRGGARSFQIWAMPDLEPDVLIPKLQQPGLRIESGRSEKEGWPALCFHLDPLADWKPVTTATHLLTQLRNQLGPDRLFAHPGARPEFFDKLMGTDQIRLQIKKG